MKNDPEIWKKAKGFDKNPQNINRTGLNRKLPDLIEGLVDVLDEDELRAILKGLLAKAKKGGVREAELILKYAFGEAKQFISLSGNMTVEEKQTAKLSFKEAYMLKYGKSPE